MRRILIVLLSVALALTIAIPAISKDWPANPTWPPGVAEKRAGESAALPGKWLGQDLAGVMLATEKLLAAMPDDSYMLEPATARRLTEAGTVLVVDVRETAEFEAGHIAGAMNIPLRELPQALGRLPGSTVAPIVVYCANGHRGAMAMMVLRLWGYTEVYSIANGLNGWKVAGLPVVRH